MITLPRQVRNALRAAIALAAASLCAAVVSVAAHAQPVFESGSALAPDDLPTAFIAQRGGMSLAQATAIAQSRFRGRVVRAETQQQGNRVVHVIRILGDDGRVRTVRIDAETGAMM